MREKVCTRKKLRTGHFLHSGQVLWFISLNLYSPVPNNRGGVGGGGGGVDKKGRCITASGNILASGNISLKLFMGPLGTKELLTF